MRTSPFSGKHISFSGGPTTHLAPLPSWFQQHALSPPRGQSTVSHGMLPTTADPPAPPAPPDPPAPPAPPAPLLEDTLEDALACEVELPSPPAPPALLAD